MRSISAARNSPARSRWKPATPCALRRGEAKLIADIFRYFGGLAGELKGETIPLGEHVLSYTRCEPLGVVGAIIPWNAPVPLGALKIAPALVAGNTLVLKAAEDAPLGVCSWRNSAMNFCRPAC